jgi:hypothetical protein
VGKEDISQLSPKEISFFMWPLAICLFDFIFVFFVNGIAFSQFKLSDSFTLSLSEGYSIPRIIDIPFSIAIGIFFYWVFSFRWDKESANPALEPFAVSVFPGLVFCFIPWLAAALIFAIFSGLEVGFNRGLIAGITVCFLSTLFIVVAKVRKDLFDYNEISIASVVRYFLGTAIVVLLVSGLTTGFLIGAIVAAIFFAAITLLYLLGVGVYWAVVFLVCFPLGFLFNLSGDEDEEEGAGYPGVR